MTNVLSEHDGSTESIQEKLRATKIVKHSSSHLRVRDQAKCLECILRPCVQVCPGGVYSFDKRRGLTIAYENCLECGSCKIVCEFDNIEWNYPPEGFGVDLRWG